VAVIDMKPTYLFLWTAADRTPTLLVRMERIPVFGSQAVLR